MESFIVICDKLLFILLFFVGNSYNQKTLLQDHQVLVGKLQIANHPFSFYLSSKQPSSIKL